MQIKPQQHSEHATARTILVYEPELAVFVNCLHPAGSLYECPINPESALAQHRNFQKVLQSHGINVLEVCEILRSNTTDPAQRLELEEYAAQQLTYIGPEEYASDDYKMKVIKSLSPESLVKVILTAPVVYLEATTNNTNVITTKTEMRALGNIVFTRDQQITTAKGVVIGNFSAEQRLGENALMEFVLKKIGIRPIGRIGEFTYERHIPICGGANKLTPKATIEGGDFIALNNGIGALGVGLRSSYTAGIHLMEHDLLGTDKFIIVKDTFDQDQDRMHLDCTCSPLHDKLILIDEEILINPDKLRYVDEWVHLGGYSDEHKSFYALNEKRTNIELKQYLEQSGYSIIAIPHKYQLAYGCNMLHLGFTDGAFHILTVHEESKLFIERHPVFKTYCQKNNIRIVVEYVPFRSITSMYGSLHCATQVLERDVPTAAIDKCNSQVLNDEKLFDAALFIPTFFASKETIKEVYELYEKLRKEGKNVYLINKYKITELISFKNLNAKNVEGLLAEIYGKSAKKHFIQPKKQDGAVTAIERDGLSLDDILYIF
ncbi:Arginine deiminase [Spironucleus salmonicida]|uniref:Arginine deiminase n=1 Tax=Spironucleus salmonicida TaxID=348837 RepID=V6LYQ5_9EUKA|nr:Arginine deiminase [Spironucleus salmonicida]|eukprot:EST48861.1 Arginine deiminase [Spironucleus salmonicida]